MHASPEFTFRASVEVCTRRHRLLAAFTLTELLVVMAVISILAALLLPTLGKAKEAGKATACLSNLRQIGTSLQLYVDDNHNLMPFMRDRDLSLTNEQPTPDLVLSNYLGNRNILRCPSDNQELFQTTGSSYSWLSLLNTQNASSLRVMNMDVEPHRIPVFFDKAAFHAARGKGRGINFLYADGHIRNLLAIEGVINNNR
jgi:prepilin-type N-terminal cleavage/methylation domain-containing protein/prepilin-type processing-associated H-X9-DG protein